MIRVVVLKFGVHLMWFQFGVRWFDMDMYVYTEPLKMEYLKGVLSWV
jgi:hypothetical protein